MTAPPTLFFLWENFGPMHVDRCEAVAARFPAASVIGLELYHRSEVYDWTPETGAAFEKRTIFPEGARPGLLSRAHAVWSAIRACGRAEVFLCHYERPEILIAAILCRLTGRRVHTMSCSKFDDMPRRAWREFLKSLWLFPYRGAISSTGRPAAYLRFLGVPRVEVAYNTLSLARIRAAAGAPPAPEGAPFAERHFTIVARLVEKKNLATALDAYARYHAAAEAPRDLVICGSGALEAQLREQAKDLPVHFTGFLESPEIAKHLATTLALLLPSTEEQFGNVVIEAQAMGLPVILSDAAGARDTLVRSARNGFVVEPDNPDGLAWFMARLAGDEALWRGMSLAATETAELGDSARFADAVAALTGPP
jgi:glycosyltransferase involved in cell wall biosynthesis